MIADVDVDDTLCDYAAAFNNTTEVIFERKITPLVKRKKPLMWPFYIVYRYFLLVLSIRALYG